MFNLGTGQSHSPDPEDLSLRLQTIISNCQLDIPMWVSCQYCREEDQNQIYRHSSYHSFPLPWVKCYLILILPVENRNPGITYNDFLLSHLHSAAKLRSLSLHNVLQICPFLFTSMPIMFTLVDASPIHPHLPKI